MEPFTKVTRKPIKQDADAVLPNFKRQMLGLSFDEQIIATNPRCIHYCRNIKRIKNKDDILYRQYYNGFVDVSHLQVLPAVQLKDSLLKSLHGQAGKHHVISKKKQENRQKNIVPSFANHVRKWVEKCQTRSKDKWTDISQTTTEFISMPIQDLGQEKVMQIGLLPELPPRGGYENIITAIDVFPRYALALPISNPTVVKTAKVIIDILIRHANLPTLIITNKLSIFVSNVIHEIAAHSGFQPRSRHKLSESIEI